MRSPADGRVGLSSLPRQIVITLGIELSGPDLLALPLQIVSLEDSCPVISGGESPPQAYLYKMRLTVKEDIQLCKTVYTFLSLIKAMRRHHR